MRYIYESLNDRAEALLQTGTSRADAIEELENEFPHTTTGTIMDVVDAIIEELRK